MGCGTVVQTNLVARLVHAARSDVAVARHVCDLWCITTGAVLFSSTNRVRSKSLYKVSTRHDATEIVSPTAALMVTSCVPCFSHATFHSPLQSRSSFSLRVPCSPMQPRVAREFPVDMAFNEQSFGQYVLSQGYHLVYIETFESPPAQLHAQCPPDHAVSTYNIYSSSMVDGGLLVVS